MQRVWSQRGLTARRLFKRTPQEALSLRLPSGGSSSTETLLPLSGSAGGSLIFCSLAQSRFSFFSASLRSAQPAGLPSHYPSFVSYRSFGISSLSTLSTVSHPAPSPPSLPSLSQTMAEHSRIPSKPKDSISFLEILKKQIDLNLQHHQPGKCPLTKKDILDLGQLQMEIEFQDDVHS